MMRYLVSVVQVLLLVCIVYVSSVLSGVCDSVTTSDIPELGCSSNGCVYAGGQITLDASSMSTVALCFDTSSLSSTLIDLSNIRLMVSAMTS